MDSALLAFWQRVLTDWPQPGLGKGGLKKETYTNRPDIGTISPFIGWNAEGEGPTLATV